MICLQMFALQPWPAVMALLNAIAGHKDCHLTAATLFQQAEEGTQPAIARWVIAKTGAFRFG